MLIVQSSLIHEKISNIREKKKEREGVSNTDYFTKVNSSTTFVKGHYNTSILP